MDSFDFFMQGKYKKIATEHGLFSRNHLIFQFIIFNLSAVSSFFLNEGDSQLYYPLFINHDNWHYTWIYLEKQGSIYSKK